MQEGLHALLGVKPHGVVDHQKQNYKEGRKAGKNKKVILPAFRPSLFSFFLILMAPCRRAFLQEGLHALLGVKPHGVVDHDLGGQFVSG